MSGSPGERACPACESRSAMAIGPNEGFGIKRCTSCATLFVDRLLSQDQALDYDAHYHSGNLTVPEFVDRRLDEIVAGLEDFRRTSRSIDVGCGAGSLLRAVAQAGWRAEGTEVSAAPLEMLRGDGFDVMLGDLIELELERGAYDVVSLVEVIEHVPDPRALMRRAAELLRPGGVVSGLGVSSAAARALTRLSQRRGSRRPSAPTRTHERFPRRGLSKARSSAPAGLCRCLPRCPSHHRSCAGDSGSRALDRRARR